MEVIPILKEISVSTGFENLSLSKVASGWLDLFTESHTPCFFLQIGFFDPKFGQFATKAASLTPQA